MKTALNVFLIATFVATAWATPYTAYVNEFTSTSGISIVEPCTGPRLAEGGAWGDAPDGFTGYGTMNVLLDPANGINTTEPVDFTYGEFTVRLQWTSDYYLPDATVTIWVRLTSRRWDAGQNAWVASGSQNYGFLVIQGPPGGPPGWQEWTVDVNDWTETSPEFDPEQVYHITVQAVEWDPFLTPWSWGIEHFELVVPECPNDLTGDDDVDLSDLAELLSWYGCDAATINPIFDSAGFESFNYGDLPGQQGFQDMTTDNDPADPYVVGPPQIVDDPSGSGMGKVIIMDPPHHPNPDLSTGWSGFYKALDAPVTGGYFSISWDQYRPDGGDNVWISDDPLWDGWWSIEWDSHGSGDISTYEWQQFIPLTFNTWQHIQYKYNLETDLVVLIVDGEVRELSYADPDGIEGLYMDITDTFVAGDGPIYIDNLMMGTIDDWLCIGDYDEDNDTDLSDLAELLGSYGCGVHP